VPELACVGIANSALIGNLRGSILKHFSDIGRAGLRLSAAESSGHREKGQMKGSALPPTTVPEKAALGHER
jgi:hypothetical protein